jgi:hypothetical protein
MPLLKYEEASRTDSSQYYCFTRSHFVTSYSVIYFSVVDSNKIKIQYTTTIYYKLYSGLLGCEEKIKTLGHISNINTRN